ncbi:hypothetical protein [Chitiniphilus eburneus]|uniref:WG repeat-containing protein n=1 Tax=Chitiniphilus eburneus TaxID=2571148 RepID=A0A4U0PFI0_9NEIS|nr:hypothetical protein [Chitiniphilus eburneus]TJZ66663.1 hypothetical protein FAZ21_17180 [Chitiniphilus eburneus]
MLVAMALTIGTPAWAVDYDALSRGLQQLQRVLEQNDRDNELREAQEQAEQARRQAEQQRRAQQEASAKQRNRDQELAGLTPPAEWAGQPVFHRRQLERGDRAATEPRPAFDITSNGTVGMSQDGKRLGYVNLSNQLVIRELPGGRERVLREGLNKEVGWSVYFVGERSILLNGGFAKNGYVELMDGDGQRLQLWQGGDFQAYPVEGRLQVQRASYYPDKYCKGVWLYDERGQVVQQLVPPSRVDSCWPRAGADGSLEVVTVDGNTLTDYFNGERRQSFRGDTRHGDSSSPLIYSYVGTLPYLVSYLNGDENSREPFQLWDIAQGKALCQIARRGLAWLTADKQDNVYITRPPQRVSLPDCQVTALAASGTLTLDGDLGWIHQPETGAISVLTLPSNQEKYRLQSPFRDDSLYAQRLPGQQRYLAVGMWSWNVKGGQTMQIFDLENGTLAREQPGGLSWNSHFSTRADIVDGHWHTQGWPIALGGKAEPSADPQQFLASMKKDKYESTAEYRARVAQLTLPYQMEIGVKDYDADGGYFVGEWRGVPIGVPVPPAQARRLDGQTTLSLKGQLAVLDENFLMLRDASVLLPDGGTLPLATRAAASAATALPKPTLALAKPPLVAAKGKQAAASCNGTLDYLAPQLRAYTSPELAEVRRTILGSNMAQMLAEARQQGATADVVQQMVDQAEQAASEAATTAEQSDGGGNSIQRADNGTLPLQWPCEGIHASSVCAYVLHKWEALTYRELGQAMARCN